MLSVFSRLPRLSRLGKNFASVLHYRAVVLLALVSVVAIATAMYGSTSVASGESIRPEITIRAAGRVAPYLNLQDGRPSQVAYRGEHALVEAMRSGDVQSRALAFADLNGDVAPDLIAGYAYGNVGIVTVQLGNT